MGVSDPGQQRLKTKTTPGPVWHSQASKFQDVGSFDYGRNYGVVYDVTSWYRTHDKFGGDTDGLTTSCSSVVTALRPTVTLTSSVRSILRNFAVQYQGKNGERKRRRHDQQWSRCSASERRRRWRFYHL
ncbi:porin [Escherichia coli]